MEPLVRYLLGGYIVSNVKPYWFNTLLIYGISFYAPFRFVILGSYASRLYLM